MSWVSRVIVRFKTSSYRRLGLIGGSLTRYVAAARASVSRPLKNLLDQGSQPGRDHMAALKTPSFWLRTHSDAAFLRQTCVSDGWLSSPGSGKERTWTRINFSVSGILEVIKCCRDGLFGLFLTRCPP